MVSEKQMPEILWFRRRFSRESRRAGKAMKKNDNLRPKSGDMSGLGTKVSFPDYLDKIRTQTQNRYNPGPIKQVRAHVRILQFYH